jgi:Cu/Zn superoxide dismutase
MKALKLLTAALAVLPIDDHKTDPAGHAGPRIACGVIKQ